MNIVEISGVIKEYGWGNTTFIADFLGLEHDGVQRAELWYATHPDGESEVVAEGEPLGSFLAQRAHAWFGDDHLALYGPVMPLLLKILAIDKPLSLQVHPTKEQAEAGWEAEKAIRERLAKELWNYKDTNGKPEMAYALTPTTLMCGFRPIGEIRGYLETLIPVACHEHFPFLREEGIAGEQIHQLFKTLYTLEKEALGLLLDELVKGVASSKSLERSLDGTFPTAADIVGILAQQYPGDPGLLAPFLLNVMHLRRGDALYLEPRTLHAYIQGNLIELMSASDNVLRAGLTPKKVDVRELLKVMETREQHIELAPTLIGSSGRLHILTPTEDFHLMVLESGRYAITDRRSIELLLVAEGEALFTDGEEQVALQKGRCYAVASSASSYTLEVDGLVFAADVPR